MSTENEKLRALLAEARVALQGVAAYDANPDVSWTLTKEDCRDALDRIDAALAEPVVDPVQAWKDANGYNDLLAAYSSTITERDEARAEVAAAYQRGAEAMREAAAQDCIDFWGKGHSSGTLQAERIRALPLPEDKP